MDIDDTHDWLADLFFHTFPAADGEELGNIINVILRMMECQIRRARIEERRLLYVRAQLRSRN